MDFFAKILDNPYFLCYDVEKHGKTVENSVLQEEFYYESNRSDKTA